MSKELKDQLVRLGASRPDLRENIRPILAGLEKTKTAGLPPFNFDKHVPLEGLMYATQKKFLQDVAQNVLHYATMDGPMRGKGNVYMERGTAAASLYDHSTGIGMGVTARIKGNKILVTITDGDGKEGKNFTFSFGDTSASIAASCSWYGTQLLG